MHNSDLTLANTLYHEGNPIMSDKEYDNRIGRQESKNIGFELSQKRKVRLPIRMASLSKVKTQNEINQWIKKCRLKDYDIIILTPKLDGISLLNKENEVKTYTRGNGVEGLDVSKHRSFMNFTNSSNNEYTHGEAIMSNKNFKKYKDEFATARNLVAGIFNQLSPNKEILKDIDFIRYSIYSNVIPNKGDQLAYLSHTFHSQKTIPYFPIIVSQLKESLLLELYSKWNEEYQIDGIVIDINDKDVRANLGRKPNGNPNYAVAYKGNFEEVKEAIVIGIDWKVSKQGFLKPTVIVEPVVLDGAVINRVTGNNAKYIIEEGINIGAKIKIKRSGQVIPKIIKIIMKGQVHPVITCPSCNQLCEWNETKVELVCMNPDCKGVKLAKLVSFFDIIGVINFGEKNIQKFFNSGYISETKIIDMTIAEIEKIEGYAKKSATQLWRNIRDKITNIPLSKLQHASGLYKGLGEKTLQLIGEYIILHEKTNQVINLNEIEGVNDITIKNYLVGEDYFGWYLKKLEESNVSVELPQVRKIESDKYKTFNIVFSGIRDKKLEAIITSNGGKVSNGISNKVTHLIVKEVGKKKTSKINKAIISMIPIVTLTEFRNLIK